MNGTVSALLSAFELCYDDLVGYVRARVGCSATAADIVQDTYLRVRAVEGVERIGNPRAFVYRVAANLAIDHLRQERSRGPHVTPDSVAEGDQPRAPSPEAELQDRERPALLMKAVEELPPRCREVFVLRKIENLHQAEIAERLGISRNMVEKHMRRALMHCLRKLGQIE